MKKLSRYNIKKVNKFDVLYDYVELITAKSWPNYKGFTAYYHALNHTYQLCGLLRGMATTIASPQPYHPDSYQVITLRLSRVRPW